MTTEVMANPRPSGSGGHIVDDDVFRLLVDMEVQKAQRLRYLVSVICIDVEGTGAIPEAVRMMAPVIRATDAVAARDRSTVAALLLVAAEASDLGTILERLKSAGLESVAWSAGGACYPQTAGSAQELLDQALEMMARSKQDGGRRFYIPTTTS